MKTLFYFIFISNVHTQEITNNNTKKVYIDEAGDKITVLDFESKKMLSATNEIKPSNIYEDGLSKEKKKIQKPQVP